jgi:hypothetical protein
MIIAMDPIEDESASADGDCEKEDNTQQPCVFIYAAHPLHDRYWQTSSHGL